MSDKISLRGDIAESLAVFTVSVNGEAQQIPTATTIDGLLAQLELGSLKGVAVAINSEVISRSNWGVHVLNQDDEVLLITAAQGG